jgi:hypothetical protein
MDCNPGICRQLTKEESVRLCLHVAELPFVFGALNNYASKNPVKYTWDNPTTI